MNLDNNLKKITGQNHSDKFIKQIIDGMYDWVRVLDRDNNIIYLNNAMAEGLKTFPAGQKCYEIVGKTGPCEICISRKSVFDGNPHEKEEIIDGKVFSVMSSPVKNEDGDIVAVVEVLRDITQFKHLQQTILEQNKKLQDDLNVAKKLQCSLLPRNLPEDKINFSFIYKPCEALGGDFLDIFRIDDDHLGLYIADVSGHGVSASMFTIFLRTSINKKLLSPAQALKELYSEFNSCNFSHDLYITVFYAILNLRDMSITFSNAGHNVCPILFNSGRFELLRAPGTPISNWLDAPAYIEKNTSLKSGDRIFFYTDGITELKNNENEQFGEERLLDILINDTSGPSGTLNRLFNSACEFACIRNTSEIPDDITIALLEIK